MIEPSSSQPDRAIALLQARGMMRLSEFLAEGITAATIKRLVGGGHVAQLARGLYQLPDAPFDVHHALAEAAKLVPNGVVCLDSALSFHDLTDRIPTGTWIAIGARDWRPRIEHPPVNIIRFNPIRFGDGIGKYVIEQVPVRIYSPGKTVSDMFFHGLRQKRWYESDIGVAQALQAMKEALRKRKATPAEIASYTEKAGIWDAMRPYLEALVADQ